MRDTVQEFAEESMVGLTSHMSNDPPNASFAAPALQPDLDWTYTPESSTLPAPATSDSRLMDLYFEFFHHAHPCVPPRRFLEQFLSDDRAKLLLQVIYYIGSLFDPLVSSDTLQDNVNSVLSYTRCGQKPAHAFDVGAVLLYSIAIYWRQGADEGTALLKESIRMASNLGMHRKGFASQNGQGDVVLEECWRRTWWQIFMADAHLAGAAHTSSLHTRDIEMTVDLPCEEGEYETGV